MVIMTCEAGAPVVDFRFVVVLDGTLTGNLKGAPTTWEKGKWCEDDGGGGYGVSQLVVGQGGARLSVLTKENFAKTVQELGLSTVGSAEEASDRAQKMVLVKKVPLFRHLSQDQTLKLVTLFNIQRYSRDQSVFDQGEVGTCFYVIASGEVIVKINGSVVRTLGKNAYFGERALLFDEPRSATVQVCTAEAELLYVSKDAFKLMMNDNMQQELMHRISLQDTSVTLKDVKQIKVIGTGATGVVRLVEHKQTKTRYALKRVQKQGKGADLKIPDEVKRECDLLGENDHPFIMKLVKTFESAKSIYILTELITGGELHGAIRVIPTVLSRTQAQFYTGSLVIVLEELAGRNIVYRDLKPENVMLDNQGYLKLIDFGIAKKLEEGRGRTFTMVGTPHYMAPEVMRGQGYGTPVDLWSLGVIQYEFVCGYLPFADELDDPTEVCSAVLKAALNFPTRYRDTAGRNLMQGLLCRQHKKRLGAGAAGYEDVRNAEYFKDPKDLLPGGGTRLFDRIMGRELAPPLVPKGETYCDPEDAAQVVLSDAGELG
jgi:cGMP-dependent protein kinase